MPSDVRILGGAGLGLRQDLMPQLRTAEDTGIEFLEIAPENWIDVGGRLGKALQSFAERWPFVCHGLSLSLGGPTPLDTVLLAKIKTFLDKHRITLYTEHLSYCSDGGHLYDLLPIPFTHEAVRYVANRIRQAQEILGRKIAIENPSFYVMAPFSEMSEENFINAVVAEADCLLHLDVNNVYVNSVNHGYDPIDFLRNMPADRVVYIHMAGHYQDSSGLLIDSHGTAVIDHVWQLLEETYRCIGVLPTLLERDQNFPPLAELVGEVKYIAELQRKHRDFKRVSSQ